MMDQQTLAIGDTAGLVRIGRALLASGYHFVTPTPATHALVNARPGTAWARSVTDVLGWSRPFRAGTIPGELHRAMEDAGLLVASGEGWRSTLRVSCLDGLLFFHSAYPTTAPDSVFFGPDTYRFAQAIRALPPRQVRRAVDVGCGAGPGAVLMARAHPEAEIFGVDINPAALRLTGVNAALAGVTVQARHSDLLTGLDGQFDLIVANPPYLVDPGARAYRHGGGPLGAELSLAILDAACERLVPGGTVLLYTGAAIVNGLDPFHEAAAARLAGLPMQWRYREVDPDVFGEELAGGAYAEADRIAAVVLTATKLGENHA